MTFGFDPELFVMKKGARNTAESIHLLKDFKGIAGKSIDDGAGMAGKVSMKTDGFAVELNSVPETCRDRFVPSAGLVFQHFYKQYPEYKLSAVPVMKLSAESLKGKLPLGVTEFGCLPDRDAYSLQEKTPPRSDYHNNIRYTGGHLHWSLPKSPQIPADLMAAAFVIMHDIVTGIPLVSMLGNVNDYGEATRRTYYGQAGSHRVKPYGVEWRVPSSAIMLSPIMLSWIIGHMRKFHSPITIGESAIMRYHMQTQAEIEQLVMSWSKKFDFNRVRDIINGHMVAEARKFVDEFNLKPKYLPAFYDMMVDADKKEIPIPTDLSVAWNLGGRIQNHRYLGVETFLNTRGYMRSHDLETGKVGTVKVTAALPAVKLLKKGLSNVWDF